MMDARVTPIDPAMFDAEIAACHLVARSLERLLGLSPSLPSSTEAESGDWLAEHEGRVSAAYTCAAVGGV